MTEDLSAPPPLLDAGDTSKPDTDHWYYVANGTRQGPTNPTIIKALLDNRKIEADIQVWRKGMPEWKSLRDTDLAELVAADPPPISPQQIGNGYVWTLAVLPLVFGVIEAAISATNQEAAARSLVLGFPYHPSNGLPVQIPVVINAFFGWLDDRRLKQAGYGSRLTRVMAVLMTPVYLFLRAKRLRQRPIYAVAWIVSFVIGFLVYASVEG